MEFCPDCGTVLMPQEKGKNIWLVCPDCGSYKKLKREEDYKIGERKEKGKEKEVAVVEKEEKRKIRQPDYDLDTDVYDEFYNE